MSSPSTGYVRIKLDFNDGFNSGEFITISYILATSEGPYTPFENYFRDNLLIDNLNGDDEIEVIRNGFTSGDTYTFRAKAWNDVGAKFWMW